MNLLDLVQRPLRTIEPSCTLREAARQMVEHTVGSLVITDASGVTALHVVTDRDIVVMLAEGLDPDTATVDCLAYRPLQTIGVGAALADAAHAMRVAGVRRLPIVDSERRLVGVVTLDDVLVALGREMADVEKAIRSELAHEREVAYVRERVARGRS